MRGKVCYECAMDYEQEWKGVAIQTNSNDDFAAAIIDKLSLQKPLNGTLILL